MHYPSIYIVSQLSTDYFGIVSRYQESSNIYCAQKFFIYQLPVVLD